MSEGPMHDDRRRIAAYAGIIGGELTRGSKPGTDHNPDQPPLSTLPRWVGWAAAALVFGAAGAVIAYFFFVPLT